MPYASEQLYFTFGGTIGGSAEYDVWQCGVHYAPIVIGGIVGDPNADQAEALWDGTEDLFTSAYFQISSSVRLKWVKLAKLDVNGEYTTEPAVYEAPTYVSGPTAPAGTPPQVATAVTLSSGQTLGKANWGRFYLPQTQTALQADGATVSDANLAGMAAAGVAFLAASYTAIEENKTSGGILDATNMSSVGAGVNKRVTEVRVGSVKDTQRRRRNRIPESYITAAR